jgi:hypothetical protein
VGAKCRVTGNRYRLGGVVGLAVGHQIHEVHRAVHAVGVPRPLQRVGQRHDGDSYGKPFQRGVLAVEMQGVQHHVGTAQQAQVPAVRKILDERQPFPQLWRKLRHSGLDSSAHMAQ